uniref:DNA-(apurinic or apyrimidinic site) endonuclease 2 n=2 Tax=Cordyceps TaxID=45234 RepID=Q874E5_CORTN|nr:DNA lyase [Cordyceps tenuipes]
MAFDFRNPFGYQPWREKRTFQAMFDILEADIVILQETKIQRKDLQDDMVLVPGWDVYFSLPQHKKGYSGVAIYTKNATCAPILAEEGILGILCPPKSNTPYRELPEDRQIGGYPTLAQLSGDVDEALLDSEGRCLILEFPAFVLFGVYSPANRDESRIEFRQSFVEALEARIRNLVAAGKQVILTGDLNIIRSEMDSSNVAEGLKKEGMTMEEWQSMPTRRILNQLLFDGSVIGPRDKAREDGVLWDICRCFHPTRRGMHTCWDTKRNTRPANLGSRIDYILCSDGIKDWFVDSNIQEGLMGSDHCPVYATMRDKVVKGGKETSLAEILNPANMFRDGQRIRNWEQRDALALSAKLIPEFDRRRNIRDMFTNKAAHASFDRGNKTGSGARDGEDMTQLGTTMPRLQSEGSVGVERERERERERVSQNKRHAGPAQVGIPANKKSKGSSDTKTKVASGQTTLQGFFKPKSTATAGGQGGPLAGPCQVPGRAQTPPLTTRTVSRQTPTSSQMVTVKPVEENSSGKVFDPIEAKESWSKLLGRRVVPKCEHEEPCISLVTKKPGVNCGRSFYICPRPVGPSGDKERDTEWRCGTFIWSSDWNGGASLSDP